MSGTTDDRSATAAARNALGGGLDRTRRAIHRRLARLYAGDWVSIALTVVAVLAVAPRLIGRQAALFALAAGAAMAVAVAFANGSNPLVRVVAGAVTIGAAVVAVPALATAAAFALGSGGAGLVTGAALLSFVLAGFAAALAPIDAPGGGSVGRTANAVLLAGVGVVAATLGRIAPETDARGLVAGAATDVASSVVELAVFPSSGNALVSWLAVVAVAGFVGRRALRRVPVERMLPPERRDAANGLLARIGRYVKIISRIAGVGALAALVPTLAGVRTSGRLVTHVETIRAELPAPAGDLVVELLVSPVVRQALLATIVAGSAVVAAARIRDSLRRGLARAIARLLAPVAGGAVAGTAAAYLLADPSLPGLLADAAPGTVPPSLLELVLSAPPFVAAGGALLVALGVLWTALLGISFLRAVRILPGRATGSALAAVALFVTAVAAALIAEAGAAVGATVAALVVWDVGEFGTGLREELPAGTPTFRVEVVHAGASLLIAGGIGAAALWAHGRLADLVAVSDPRLAVVAVASTALGAALAAAALRG